LKFGGYDARFGYFDDQTLHLRTGITTAIIVKEAYLYHYNPDTAKEILW
jgi:hypothetical protein